jgi:hypothetical protein
LRSLIFFREKPETKSAAALSALLHLWKRNPLLSIATAIVEAHGGRISVQSAAGAGTIFKVFLPR